MMEYLSSPPEQERTEHEPCGVAVTRMVDSNSHPEPWEFSALNRPNVFSWEAIVAEKAREFNTVGAESHFTEGPAGCEKTNAHRTTPFSSLRVLHGRVSSGDNLHHIQIRK